ncbi:MAG: hypoxanthine phosphoribosyltransferase [Cyclobacteriaceae bacterium]|nr:MAG: hypoxanthine phosphoribosyltransferase [Cyclobacteriaceae bacterium]
MASDISHIVKVHQKEFETYISYSSIQERTREIAARINEDYAGRSPLFIGVLNGVFMFAADLMKGIELPSEISFIKLSSYKDTSSSGNILELIGLKENLKDIDIIIIEDIIDTGETISHVVKKIQSLGPRSVEIATLLLKPEIFNKSIPLKYVGFKIPHKFVIGYGLDYNGLGRNLKDIYQIKEPLDH